MKVVVDVVQMFGQVAIGRAAAITTAGFLLVYLVYFLLTYWQAKRVVQ